MPFRPAVGKYVEITNRVFLKLQAYNILVGHIILMCSWYVDYVVGQLSSRTHHRVLPMAALDKSLSMV